MRSDKGFKGVETREALGACLQLLICGSYLYGSLGTEVGKVDILAALEKIKRARIVKHPNGLQLLEVCR